MTDDARDAPGRPAAPGDGDGRSAGDADPGTLPTNELDIARLTELEYDQLERDEVDDRPASAERDEPA